MRSSRVANLGGSDLFWYLTMYFGARHPWKSSLVGSESSGRASESGSEVGSLVGFSLGGPGYGVGSAEGGLLRESSLSDSTG